MKKTQGLRGLTPGTMYRSGAGGAIGLLIALDSSGDVTRFYVRLHRPYTGDILDVTEL